MGGGLRLFHGLIGIALLASGCFTPRPKLDPNINYQRDLRFKVETWDDNKGAYRNVYKFDGVGLAIKANKYKITLYPPKGSRVDMLTATSCHREFKQADPKTDGWFSKGYSFEYDPAENIETRKSCPLDFGSYEKKGGRHGCGMLVLDTIRDNVTKPLLAKIKCNGEVYQSNRGQLSGSVSVCQAKAGVIQKIKFDIKVDMEAIQGCKIKVPDNGKDFMYIMPEADCVLYFCDWFDDKRCHKHVTYGYDYIPIRGIE